MFDALFCTVLSIHMPFEICNRLTQIKLTNKRCPFILKMNDVLKKQLRNDITFCIREIDFYINARYFGNSTKLS